MNAPLVDAPLQPSTPQENSDDPDSGSGGGNKPPSQTYGDPAVGGQCGAGWRDPTASPALMLFCASYSYAATCCTSVTTCALVSLRRAVPAL